MIFNSIGIPKPNGASDWDDSTHLVGVLAYCNHPYFANINVSLYVINGMYVRNPLERRADFSRDQAIMLMYALYKAGRPDLIGLERIDGKDLYSPAVRGMVRIMKGGKAYFWEKWWLELDLWINRKFQRLEEPYQLMAMCDVYGKSYLKKWTEGNKLWMWAIRRYFKELDGAWRNEPDLAETSITVTYSKVA